MVVGSISPDKKNLVSGRQQMGAVASSDTRREYENATACFSEEERAKVLDCFGLICSQQFGEEKATDFSFPEFEKFSQHIFSKSFQNEIFLEFASAEWRCGRRGKTKNRVSEAAFTIVLSHMLKGSLGEKCHIFRKLCVGESSYVSADQLVKFLEELINTYVIVESDTAEFSTWAFRITERSEANLAEFLITDLCARDSRGYDSDDLEKWLGRSSLILTMMDAVFQTAFHFKLINEEMKLKSFYTPTIPFCIKADWHSFKTILNIPSLLFLNHDIPVEFRRQWRLLFGSATHGESFSTLANHIVSQGACIIVIRDKGGAVFGGFASRGFELGPQFVGDERCFLFSLHPKMDLFSATGYNSNFCYLNLHQETMPNGLGFGGRLEIQEERVGSFGLWLDSEYGKGRSMTPCSTFSNGPLSSSQEFSVDTIEVWGVGPREGTVKGKRTSLLDIDPEVKAMLSMIGRGPHSEGLRESDQTAQNPEEHQL